MTFQQFHYILEVARTGSVSKAAKNLFVTRPGVSFCIRTLEEELGFPVFLRTAKGLVPSPKGMKVLEYAQRICDTQQQLVDMRQETRPRVEIALTDYLPVENAVVRLVEENKDRRDIAFTMAGSGDPYRKLAAAELETVISCKYNKPEPRLTDGIVTEELRQVPVAVVLGPGHRLYGKENLTPADFENEILLDTASRMRTRSKILGRSIPFNTDTVLVAGFPNTRQRLLAEGLGFEIRRMPSQEYIDRTGVRCLRLEGVYQYLCYSISSKHPLASEAERFLAILHEELENYQDPQITETITPLWMETQ